MYIIMISIFMSWGISNSPSSDSKSRELCDHILDALLVGLEKAFLSFDVPTVKAYFNFVVQLENGESTIKPIIKRAIDATSGDDDEDYGTSDGELASMDKEDDDESNSEQ